MVDFIAAEGRATTREIAAALERPPTTLREYLHELRGAGVVAVVDKIPRRGGFENVYSVILTGLLEVYREAETMGVGQERRHRLQIARLTFNGTAHALKASLMERRDEETFRWTRGCVDEQGWADLAAIHRRAFNEAQRILRESAERMRKHEVDSIRIASALFFFEAPAIGSDHDGRGSKKDF
jgi:hypothetical protein